MTEKENALLKEAILMCRELKTENIRLKHELKLAQMARFSCAPYYPKKKGEKK